MKSRLYQVPNIDVRKIGHLNIKTKMLDIEAHVLIGWYSLASQSELVPTRCFYVKVAYLSYGEYIIYGNCFNNCNFYLSITLFYCSHNRHIFRKTEAYCSHNRHIFRKTEAYCSHNRHIFRKTEAYCSHNRHIFRKTEAYCSHNRHIFRETEATRLLNSNRITYISHVIIRISIKYRHHKNN